MPPTIQKTNDGPQFTAVLACFFLSGFAALVYQTAWLRQFSVVFGTSELAVATVLAAYMAGLALGATAAGRLLHRVRRPVLWYGILEAGVALGALLVPLGLRAARLMQDLVIGDQSALVDSGGPAQSAFYLLTTFLVVLVPTTCMGATLPLLTRHVVRRRDHIGPRVGLLYTTNTAGAVVGTLTGAFVFLPQYGLAGTIYVGVAANALVFILAALIATRAPQPVPDPSPAMDGRAAQKETIPDNRVRWILPLIALSGSVSFTYEVLWTRLLSHILGGSVYAFAAMLASFLTGITIGGAIASLLARTRQAAAIGFTLCQLGIAALAAWVYAHMDGLPAVFLERMAEPDASPQAVGARMAFTLLLPATVLIGATFPFALRVLARSRTEAGQASARVYAWNTVGAILGALLAGFWLIPSLGFAGTARLAVGVSLALAAPASMTLLWPTARWLCIGTCASLLTIVAYQPQSPVHLLRHAPLEPEVGAAGEVLFTAVGHSATVLVIDREDALEIRSNGLPEAGVTPEGMPPYGRNAERFLTALPVLARPEAKTMLVIGFGGGVALENIPPSITDLDVVELEPQVLKANHKLSGRRAKDPFDDPRLNVIRNDARGALTLTDKRWDIIVSQPSHPWTAGASHLYTLEFAALCKEHLAPGGVFVQWINAGFLDPELFASVGATLLDTYEHLRLYRPISSMLLFLASAEPLDVERELVRTGAPIASNPDYWNAAGISDVNELLALLALDQRGIETLCAAGTVSTDDRNVLAMASGMDLPEGLHMETTWKLLAPADPLLAEGASLLNDLGAAVDPFTVLRAMGSATPLRASALPENFQTPSADDQPFFQVGPALPAAGRGAPGTAGIGTLARTWTGLPGLIWKGWTLVGNGRWQDLSQLDDELAGVPPSSPWFAHACRLRAHGRLATNITRIPGQVQPQSLIEANAREAIELLDRAILREPSPGALLLRLEAARNANWTPGILGTLKELLVWMGPPKSSLPPITILELETGLRPWSSNLDALRNTMTTAPGDPSLERLTTLQDRLKELLPPIVPREPATDGSGQQFR